MADLVDALFQAGRMEDAFRYAADVVARAAAAGDRARELCARIEQGTSARISSPRARPSSWRRTSTEALPVFEAAGDDFGLFTAYLGLVQVAHMHARMDAQLEAVEQALRTRERLGRHSRLWSC